MLLKILSIVLFIKFLFWNPKSKETYLPSQFCSWLHNSLFLNFYHFCQCVWMSVCAHVFLCVYWHPCVCLLEHMNVRERQIHWNWRFRCWKLPDISAGIPTTVSVMEQQVLLTTEYLSSPFLLVVDSHPDTAYKPLFTLYIFLHWNIFRNSSLI